MVVDLEVRHGSPDPTAPARPTRTRRRGRPTLGRPRSRSFGGRSAPSSALHPAVLSDAERARRLAIAARTLVRTIRGCPAPGVPPLRARDWLALLVVLVGPYLIGLAVLAAVGR